MIKKSSFGEIVPAGVLFLRWTTPYFLWIDFCYITQEVFAAGPDSFVESWPTYWMTNQTLWIIAVSVSILVTYCTAIKKIKRLKMLGRILVHKYYVGMYVHIIGKTKKQRSNFMNFKTGSVAHTPSKNTISAEGAILKGNWATDVEAFLLLFDLWLLQERSWEREGELTLRIFL